MKKNERTLKEVLGDFLHSPKIRDKYYQVSGANIWEPPSPVIPPIFDFGKGG